MRGFRSGTYAVLDGVTRPGLFPPGSRQLVLRADQPDNPDPAYYVWNQTHRLWVAHVSLDRVDRIYSVETHATWRRLRVVVGQAAPGGAVSVRLVDEDVSRAVDNGFRQVDKYEYGRDVLVVDLTDVHEIEKDLFRSG